MSGQRKSTARGETVFETAGRRFTLVLTLGALAEIERDLGLSSLGELQARLNQACASDILSVLTALMRAGGHAVERDTVAALPIEPAAAAEAIAACFNAAQARP